MVAKAEMVCIALRYDTTMSHAFLRALDHPGATARRHRHRGGRGERGRECARYSGMLACFRNPTSPMDWH